MAGEEAGEEAEAGEGGLLPALTTVLVELELLRLDQAQAQAQAQAQTRGQGRGQEDKPSSSSLSLSLPSPLTLPSPDSEAGAEEEEEEGAGTEAEAGAGEQLLAFHLDHLNRTVLDLSSSLHGVSTQHIEALSRLTEHLRRVVAEAQAQAEQMAEAATFSFTASPTTGYQSVSAASFAAYDGSGAGLGLGRGRGRGMSAQSLSGMLPSADGTTAEQGTLPFSHSPHFLFFSSFSPLLTPLTPTPNPLPLLSSPHQQGAALTWTSCCGTSLSPPLTPRRR